MSDLNEKDFEALLGGRAPEGLEPLAGLVARLKREASLPADATTATRHVAAAAAASREAPAPVQVPGSPARRLWRRRTVFAGLLSTIIGKVMIGAMALAAATAGAGAAGVLPDPVQQFFDGNPEIRRIVDQYRQQEQSGDLDRIRDQEQSQIQDQEQVRDRDQLGEQTGTTMQHQNQWGPGNEPGSTGSQQQSQWGQENCGGSCSFTTTAPQQQTQQQQQGLNDEDNDTRQQQQQSQGEPSGKGSGSPARP